MDKPQNIKSDASAQELNAYRELLRLFKDTPIPDTEILGNLSLFSNRIATSRMLFMHNLYRKIIDTHGVIMEFGVRWGQNLSLFTTFRNIYEPYNTSRKLIGFDTFEGFPEVSDEDGDHEVVFAGNCSVAPGYENTLQALLAAKEQLAPRSHIRRFELVKGDARTTLPAYLEEHPETIVALAYFDMDLYEPTRECLRVIRPYLAKNSIVGFDQLLLQEFPGETKALRDVWGTEGYEVVRDPVSHQQSYIRFT